MNNANWLWALRRRGAGIGIALAALSLGAWLAGCAGHPGGATAPAPWNAPAADQAAAAPQLASDAARHSPVPAQRPGLGTGWGDEVASTVGLTEFARAASRPAGTDAIWYNDREGLEAMGGREWRVEPLQQAAGGLVEWGVKARVGWLPAYKSGWRGEPRRFVQGTKGGRYALVVKNRCRSRLEVVLSVDGLDVLDGRPASFAKRGYIIGPGETLEVKGFRTSTRAVAAFQFSSVGASYANLRHGDTRNVGVIGLAVFTERGVDPWRWMPAEVGRRDAARPFAEAP